MNPPYQLPLAPVDSVMDESVQTGVTIVMGAFALGALLFSIYHWRKSGRPIFLLLFVAGGAMMLFEPMVDTVGAVWFPEVDSWVAFTLYGRPIPVWLCLAYFFYFGIGVGVGYLYLKSKGGATRQKLWTMFALGMLGDFILEVTLLAFDTYIYYGDQPLVLFNFPLWWAPVNSLIVVIAASAVYRLDGYLVGWRQLLIVPIALTASAAGNAAAGWPSWLVINSDLGWAAMTLGGVATFALALWLMSGIVRVVAGPDRAESRSAPREDIHREMSTYSRIAGVSRQT